MVSILSKLVVFVYVVLITAGKSRIASKRQNFKILKTCFDRFSCHFQLIDLQSVRSRFYNKKKNAHCDNKTIQSVKV